MTKLQSILTMLLPTFIGVQCAGAEHPIDRPKLKLANSNLLANGETSNETPIKDFDIGILGFQFILDAGRLPTVGKVFPGTPAEKAQLQRGDTILQIGVVDTHNLNIDQIYEMLSGKPGTAVTLQIQRGERVFKIKLRRIHSSNFAKEHPDTWKLYLQTM